MNTEEVELFHIVPMKQPSKFNLPHLTLNTKWAKFCKISQCKFLNIKVGYLLANSLSKQYSYKWHVQLTKMRV